MKVIAISGSPRVNGNTHYALERACKILNEEGIETEIITIGNKKISGCTACGFCSKNGRCVIEDEVNEIGEKLVKADGMIIGSPVYYANINGTLKSFLDRVFYTYGKQFRFKLGAAVVSLRRGGAINAYNTINNYFGITEMIVTPSIYWNDVHGAAAGECEQDFEAMQMMEALGRNMAYLIKMKAESKIVPPEKIQKVNTNFIR